MAEAFFDTNVLLYLLSEDTAKAERAEALLGGGGVISVQVLNEFASVARRKLDTPWVAVRDILGTLRAVLRVEALDLPTHDKALEFAERYRLGIYDAQILAAARLADCDVVYSEDMQDGLKVDGALQIRDPFKA
ncbi:PIN domain-containing protein [Phenylobacterium sp.]|uniref:PIN domain-containing protein n=1 Tax=Phenylobacterium sp. TaxID=1871053 RepID=UPI002DF6F31E|nr:PIN domain-containing protein [Phenylobacterium sp.]